jgi:hypothetical protein
MGALSGDGKGLSTAPKEDAAKRMADASNTGPMNNLFL